MTVLEKFQLSDLSVRFDYKPKKLDLRRFFGGQYFELLNIFDLEDAELHLPSVSLTGISGYDYLLDELLRAWLPFVRHTQVPQVITGLTPIRTAVNLGSGITDLVLLPIQHYKKNGRLVNGLRKGSASFLQSTVLETARLGKRLAVGAQVILEQADDIFENDPLREEMSESQQLGIASASKYYAPPADIQEGISCAYQSLSKNIRKAAQTIIAVPVQVYERKGPGSAAKAVLRAVPVAVLRPMIGASEAVSKTLLGVEGSLNQSAGTEINHKYKSRTDRLLSNRDDWLPSGPSSFPPK